MTLKKKWGISTSPEFLNALDLIVDTLNKEYGIKTNRSELVEILLKHTLNKIIREELFEEVVKNVIEDRTYNYPIVLPYRQIEEYNENQDKITFGIRVIKDIKRNIDQIRDNSKDLGLSRSEIVELILYSFFKQKDFNPTEKVRKLAILKRQGKL